MNDDAASSRIQLWWRGMRHSVARTARRAVALNLGDASRGRTLRQEGLALSGLKAAPTISVSGRGVIDYTEQSMHRAIPRAACVRARVRA